MQKESMYDSDNSLVIEDLLDVVDLPSCGEDDNEDFYDGEGE